MDLSYFERKFENFVYVHMDIEKKNLNVSKTKPVVPRGHPLLLLLFFQNTSWMHNKVGTCTEILPRNLKETPTALSSSFENENVNFERATEAAL